MYLLQSLCFDVVTHLFRIESRRREEMKKKVLVHFWCICNERNPSIKISCKHSRERMFLHFISHDGQEMCSLLHEKSKKYSGKDLY